MPAALTARQAPVQQGPGRCQQDVNTVRYSSLQGSTQRQVYPDPSTGGNVWIMHCTGPTHPAALRSEALSVRMSWVTVS